jgi:hypothetical protein
MFYACVKDSMWRKILKNFAKFWEWPLLAVPAPHLRLVPFVPVNYSLFLHFSLLSFAVLIMVLGEYNIFMHVLYYCHSSLLSFAVFQLLCIIYSCMYNKGYRVECGHVFSWDCTCFSLFITQLLLSVCMWRKRPVVSRLLLDRCRVFDSLVHDVSWLTTYKTGIGRTWKEAIHQPLCWCVA